MKVRDIEDHDCPAWRTEPDTYDQADNAAQVARAVEILEEQPHGA